MADNKKLLIVEDNETLGQMYEDNFVLKGLEVKRVHDGEAAVAEAVKFQPALILLDIMMPNVDGFEVLKILKNSDHTKDIPIFMMTALSEGEEREKAMKLGASDYLVKAEEDLPTVTSKVLYKLGITPQN